MPYDTGLADRLRADGLIVVEVDGWKTRGRSEPDYRGFVFHHTADGPNGATPSLDGIIYGFAGSAPGPLANLLQSREPDGNDKVYVVAAGTANHAGSGGWHGLTGNSSVWGLEIEHTGVEHFPEARARISARIAAAVVRGTCDESMCCQHFEWSSAGKIDVAQDVDPDHWRALVRDALAGGGGPDPGEDPVKFLLVASAENPGWGYYLLSHAGTLQHVESPRALEELKAQGLVENPENPKVLTADAWTTFRPDDR